MRVCGGFGLSPPPKRVSSPHAHPLHPLSTPAGKPTQSYTQRQPNTEGRYSLAWLLVGAVAVPGA